MEELQGEFRQIEVNLNKINPEEKSIEEIKGLRYNRMKHALTGAFNSIESEKPENVKKCISKSNKESLSQSQVMISSEGK